MNPSMPRISGKAMSSYQKKMVTLMGDVIKLDSDGKKITIRTTDGVFVQCVLQSPVMTAIEPSRIIEVTGEVHTPSVLNVTDFNQYYQGLSDKFDRDYYNEFLNEFMKQEERHFSVERPEDHEGSVLNAVDNFSSPEPVINFSMSQGNGNGDISAMDI